MECLRPHPVNIPLDHLLLISIPNPIMGVEGGEEEEGGIATHLHREGEVEEISVLKVMVDIEEEGEEEEVMGAMGAMEVGVGEEEDLITREG